jgi:sugar phosphate isomerase/epimerase
MDRREFLGATSAIALGSLLPPACRPSHAARLDRIGLQLYTVRDVLQRDFEGTLARVAQIGYKEVEFAGYFDHSPADVRAMLDRHGLSAPSVHTGSIAPDDWKAALDAAKVVGHQYIVVPWVQSRRGDRPRRRLAVCLPQPRLRIPTHGGADPLRRTP